VLKIQTNHRLGLNKFRPKRQKVLQFKYLACKYSGQKLSIHPALSMYYIKSSESPYAIPQNFNFIMLYVTTNKSITLIKQLHKSEDILNKRKADHRLVKAEATNA
jgi:hypothetical protein